MINENIVIADLDVSHWLGLIKIARSGPKKERSSDDGRKGAISIIWKGDRCLKAMHSEKGRLTDFEFLGVDKLEQMAEREGVKSILAIEHGVMRHFMHEVQSNLSLNDNMVQQGLEIYGILRKTIESGALAPYPKPKLREVKYVAISTMMKMLLPAEELVVLVVYSDDGSIRDSSGFPIVTSGIHRFNKAAEMDLWTTTDSLVSAGLKVERWSNDYKQVNDLAAKVWGGKVFAGFHLPLSAVEALGRVHPTNQPSALMEMNKKKELIIDPFPMRLKMMLKMGGLGGKKK